MLAAIARLQQRRGSDRPHAAALAAPCTCGAGGGNVNAVDQCVYPTISVSTYVPHTRDTVRMDRASTRHGH